MGIDPALGEFREKFYPGAEIRARMRVFLTSNDLWQAALFEIVIQRGRGATSGAPIHRKMLGGPHHEGEQWGGVVDPGESCQFVGKVRYPAGEERSMFLSIPTRKKKQTEGKRGCRTMG